MKNYKIYPTQESFDKDIFVSLTAYKIIEVIQKEVNVENISGRDRNHTDEISDLFAIGIRTGTLVRARNLLLSRGINTVEKLTQMTDYDLIKINGIGRHSLYSIIELLESRGLKLKDS